MLLSSWSCLVIKGLHLKPSTQAARSMRTTTGRPPSRTPCTTPMQSPWRAKPSDSTPTWTQSAQWYNEDPWTGEQKLGFCFHWVHFFKEKKMSGYNGIRGRDGFLWDCKRTSSWCTVALPLIFKAHSSGTMIWPCASTEDMEYNKDNKGIFWGEFASKNLKSSIFTSRSVESSSAILFALCECFFTLNGVFF